MGAKKYLHGAVLAVVGGCAAAAVACSGGKTVGGGDAGAGSGSGGGGMYDSCLEGISPQGDACISCVRANCGAALDAVENGCSDFLACICPGGAFSASAAQSPACAQKEQEPSCVSAASSTSGMGTNGCTQCDGACGKGTSSGGTTSSSSSGGSGSGGANDQCANLPQNACNDPPAPPQGAPTTTVTAPHDYAIHKLYLGDTDRAGVTSTDAWKAFGYDLDGKITTVTATDVCTLVAGAPKATQVDGNGGIDNSWGENIVPIMETLSSTYSQTVDQDIQNGDFTQLFAVTGFDDSAGNTTSAAGLGGVMLLGGPFGSTPPTWDLATHWPVLPEDISGCTLANGCPSGTDPIKNAQTTFPAAFQVRGTFVSGPPIASIPMQMLFANQQLPLTIHAAVVTFQPQTSGQVTGGVIAGVLGTQELVAAMQQVAGHISTSLCSGSAFQSIATQFEQTSDIVYDGANVSNAPGTQCNAISIGLGFDATEIAIPTAADVAGAQPPAPNPCGDGG